MKKKFKLMDLDCANCAAKMEDAIKKIDGVNDATVSFMMQKLTLDADDDRFDEILKEYPGIELITEQHVPAEQPINDAQEIMSNLLTANPEEGSITAVFAAWDEPAIGAARALAEAGRDEVVVTGVDGNEQAVSMIQEGTNLKATVRQNFEGMADLVCEEMERYFGGETVEPGERYAPAELITAETEE